MIIIGGKIMKTIMRVVVALATVGIIASLCAGNALAWRYYCGPSVTVVYSAPCAPVVCVPTLRPVCGPPLPPLCPPPCPPPLCPPPCFSGPVPAAVIGPFPWW
jgi:hypothetical protein